jgi:N-acetylmuramoyl-L-alanine amidase
MALTDFVSRKEWGARPPKDPPSHNNWPVGVDLWVHHTAGVEPLTDPAELRNIRFIQNFHMDDRDWDDIGYNYLVADDGTIYEGRGFEIHGAHSPGKNHEPAVSLMGNYTTDIPSDEAHAAVYELMDFLHAGDLRGHRQNSQTTCPGDAAMKKIVLGPPPPNMDKPRPKYYFEELPHTKGGMGPQIVGQMIGYKSKDIMEVQLEGIVSANPTLPLSTMHATDGRYYILSWAPGAWGKQYRFGPWAEKDARDIKQKAREVNTKREMRAFNSRGRSLYPYPS